MIRIGDFARVGQVSVVTLRHYDEMGLLKPIEVDRFTGYRYYALAQLPRLNRILALKDLGLSLEEIRHALAEGPTVDQLRALLSRKRAELERRVREEQARLTRIEARLRQIAQEHMMPHYDVVLKTTAPMLIASRRITIPTNDQVPAYLNPAFEMVASHVASQGAAVSGPCLAIWHTPTEQYTDEDAEAVMPITKAIPSSAEVRVYELPATHVASVVHNGDFADFTAGHAALLAWIEDNGYRVAGPFREIYLKHDAHNLGDTVTEIQFPVEKA